MVSRDGFNRLTLMRLSARFYHHRLLSKEKRAVIPVAEKKEFLFEPVFKQASERLKNDLVSKSLALITLRYAHTMKQVLLKINKKVQNQKNESEKEIYSNIELLDCNTSYTFPSNISDPSVSIECN